LSADYPCRLDYHRQTAGMIRMTVRYYYRVEIGRVDSDFNKSTSTRFSGIDQDLLSTCIQQQAGMVFARRRISRRGAEESNRRHRDTLGLIKTGLPGPSEEIRSAAIYIRSYPPTLTNWLRLCYPKRQRCASFHGGRLNRPIPASALRYQCVNRSS